MLTHLQVVQSCSENWLQNMGNDLERDESMLYYEDFSYDVYAVGDKLAYKDSRKFCKLKEYPEDVQNLSFYFVLHSIEFLTERKIVW